ncbi:MAG: DEAD/DEAH box helicase family protein [Planctomycetes bacterium]|nr:DEAD/DEAH box helicase family protein [Planctomycetota bacterium]
MAEKEDAFRIIDNETVTLAQEIVSALAQATALDVAVAFFSITGYSRIIEGVEGLLNRKGTLRLLLGYHPSPGAKQLLEVLRREQANRGDDQVAVRFVLPTPDRDFHAKVYLIKQSQTATLVVGSSNLTEKGLVNNLELNYREVLPLDSPKYTGVQRWFDNLFQTVGKELKWETIEELFALPPFQPKPKPPAPEPFPKALDYTTHFIALQLRHLDVPIGGRIDPFWFQMRNVQQVLNHFKTRIEHAGIMIADEVGLGKTISAGMCIKELLARRAAKRILVVCPASVVPQWKRELDEKLDEQFVVIDKSMAEGAEELWRNGNRLIVSVDRLRDEMVTRDSPRSSWRPSNSWEKLKLNFDLAIFDESHYAKNPTSKRYAALSRLDCDFRILLSGTPIQNKELELFTQLALVIPALRPAAGQSMESLFNLIRELPEWQEAKKRVILRKLRRDADIKPLFAKRQRPDWVEHRMSASETILYTDFELYIGEQSKYYELISVQATAHIVPFIKITYLREFCSSSAAILAALVGEDTDGSLENEWNAQRTPEGRVGGSDELAAHMRLKGKILRALRDGFIDIYANESDALARIQEENPDLDLEQVEEDSIRVTLSTADEAALLAEVKSLNDFARRIQKCAPFAKERNFVEAVRRSTLEHSPQRKLVVFTAYIRSGQTLIRLLKEAGLRADFYHGGLDEGERERLIDRFWERGKGKDRPLDVLVATDAGGVGLNLQCANHVINYDLSWNPMVVEQRIGRVHRIGQLAKKVFVDNWYADVSEPPLVKAGRPVVRSIESENLRDSLEEKIRLIQETVNLSDPVIADAILSNAQYIRALLKYQAGRMSQEEYEAVKKEVVEKTKDKLKALSDLQALESVVDEAKRHEAAQHALLFDEYSGRMLQILAGFPDVECVRHKDGTVSLTPPSEAQIPSATLTTDRKVADDRKGEVQLFSVRHTLMGYTVDRLLAETPSETRKAIKLADFPPDRAEEDSGLTWGEVKERLERHTSAAQCNILLSYEIRRGASKPENVEKLVTILFLDDGSTETSDVFNGKLNLLPAQITTGQSFVTEQQKEAAIARARQILQEEVKDANKNSLEEVRLSYERRRVELESEKQKAAEKLLELGEKRKKLEGSNRPSQEIAAELREIDSDIGDVRGRYSKRDRELRELGMKQHDLFQDAETTAQVTGEPRLISSCLFAFE